MDSGRRLRGYVEEIRAAGIQAAEVVRQLLAARPQGSSPQSVSLNAVIEGLRNLLIRIVSASGSLQFNLDAKFGKCPNAVDPGAAGCTQPSDSRYR
jgi:hypothetical protein